VQKAKLHMTIKQWLQTYLALFSEHKGTKESLGFVDCLKVPAIVN